MLIGTVEYKYDEGLAYTCSIYDLSNSGGRFATRFTNDNTSGKANMKVQYYCFGY